MRRGFSLIDLILAIGIIATLFGGIFLVYFSVVDTAVNFELRRAASSLLAQRVELVRGLAYAQVGVAGGIPAGVLPQSEQVSYDGRLFIIEATVRNIDDPFDGTVTSVPADTAPADYKMVAFDISCPTCQRFTPVSITTTVAPEGLESASQNGSLFISVFDAEGLPVAGASVTVANASTSPAISFDDVTDDTGRLQLVDVPTSTQRYEVSVTKQGYSTERTYPLGGAGNPDPVNVHATVGTQTVTELSFAIDRLADVTVTSADTRCQVVPDAPFSVTGTKLIGTPDVRKVATSTTTGTGGVTTLPLEWDSYAFGYAGTQDLAGTIPYQPLSIAPGAAQPFAFILASADRPALLVATLDAGSGQPIEARVTLSGAGSATASTSLAQYMETDWTVPGSYAASSGVETGAPAGSLTLSPAGGPYGTSTTGTLESATIDLGGAPAGAREIAWAGSGGGATLIRFQVAGSDAGSGWDFVGPDGSGSSYFTSPGPLPGNVSGKRYLRYRAYLTTADASQTPALSSVSFEHGGACVPPGQRLFQGLTPGAYTVSAVAPGHAPASASVTVSPGWQQAILTLDPS